MNELRLIKKRYGEDMMRFCRDNFSTILENKGYLLKIFEKNFDNTRMLIKDIIDKNLENDFVEFIYSLYDYKRSIVKVDKTPFELLRSVGYTLYECKTEKDIKSFIKYYAEDEKLCTFNGGRLKHCFVFFAVRDGAEKLNRCDFTNPER